MSEHETVQVVISFNEYFLLGLTIFLGSLSAFLVQKLSKSLENKNTRYDIVDGLLLELKAAQKSIREEDLTTVDEKTILESVEGRKVKTNTTAIVIFTHSFFDSVVNSGQFILLDKKLREDISIIYNQLNSSNFNASLLTKMTFLIKKDDTDRTEWRKTFDLQKLTFQDIHNIVIAEINKAIKDLEKIKRKEKKGKGVS
jgi:hypothetical protein